MNQIPPLRRRRPARSCIECRRRKIKCDRTEPCAHCVVANSQCVYRVVAAGNQATTAASIAPTFRQNLPPANTSSVAASPVANTPSVGAFTPDGEFTAGSNLPWTGAASAAARRDEAVSNGSTSRSYSQSGAQVRRASGGLGQINQNLDVNQANVASRSANRLSQDGGGILAQQVRLQDAQVILNKTRVLRWSHWIGTAEEFATVVSCFAKYVSTADTSRDEDSREDRELRTLTVQIGELLRKCKELAKRSKKGRPSRCFPKLDFDLSAPPVAVADRMVDLYLHSWESAFRIVHVPSFRAQYRSYINRPDGVNVGLRLKILLVIGIGSSVENHGDELDSAFRSMVHQWIYAAQTWLSGPLEKDRLNITGIQVYCLTILARQIFSIGGDLVWMSAGSLIHRAMQIGLHRDPDHFPVMSALQAEVRRRLWATILELTLQAALDSALPPRLYLDEFDTKSPANVDDDELSESAVTVIGHDRANVYTATSMQLVLLDSLPQRLKAVRLLNGLNSELSYSDALSLDHEVGSAVRASVTLMSAANTRRPTAFQRNLVDYLLRRFLLPLHCPFAIKARSEPVFNYSQKISLDTALTILSPEPDAQFTNLMYLAGGMFREGFRCAISVTCLSLLAQVESQRLDGTLQRNFRQRETLKQAMRDMISTSSERIRLGETNFKGYMFSRMVLAQVEAAEQGTPCELKIAESALESLNFCHDVLLSQTVQERVPGADGDHLTPVSFDDGTEREWLEWDLSLFLPDEHLA